MSKLISEETKYEGPRFNVVQRIYEDDKTQKQYIRDSVELLPAAMILPITKNNEVVFIKQFREVLGKETLELPAGIIEAGEEPIVAAKRELEEETGLIAGTIEPLTEVFSSCGYSNEKLYMYYAKDLSLGQKRLDDDEHIGDIVKIPMDECIELVKKNYFEHANQNVCLMLYYLKYVANK